MSDRTLTIPDKARLRPVMLRAWELVCKGIEGGAVVVTLSREGKSRAQERHYHALINDIAKQITFFGNKRYTPEVWKALLVDQFEQEMQAMGTPLGKPGRVVTSMDGRRTITVRPSTKDFRKHEAAAFIEFLYAQGVDMGVVWSDSALEIYDHYQEAKVA